MKKLLFAIVFAGALVSAGVAQPLDEAALIRVLQSDASTTQKQDACWELKRMGSAQSVPALAKLLTHEQLYQSACDVLETMPAAEAGSALLVALKTSSGNPKAAIIHALGERRQHEATAELVRLLHDSDALIATSAARALGRIGDRECVQALQQALPRATGPVRAALVDALLDCATQLLAAGKSAEAHAIFQQFDDAREMEHVRVAAYGGLIRSAASDRALELVKTGLTDGDPAHQAAALRLAVTLDDAKATATFTSLLATAAPPMQSALLRLLQQRGDVTAAGAVMAQVNNSDEHVRVAAIVTLGSLGDATAVPLLAKAATARLETEQKAARVALTELRHGDIAGAMIAQLATATPAVQAELIRALTARMDKASAPKLLELARADNAATKRLALRGLEQLADASHLAALVSLLVDAKDAEARTAIQSVFEALADRTPSGTPLNVAPLVEALKTSEVATRVALLQVSAFFADAGLREAFRAGLKETNLVVRAAAERALCQSRDVKLMPELLELAKSSPDVTLRALALEGYVRLIGDHDANFPTPRRVQLLKAAYELATRPEEKRLILSALATAPNLESLQAVDRALREPAVRAEAEVAGARIAKALLPTEPTAATSTLRRLVEQGSTATVQANARGLLKQFDSGWLYAGPHGRAGLDAQALFDVEFAPESGREVEWRRAPGTADLARPGEVDLLSVANREQAVMYLKTRVFVPAAQEVSLEIGSDDGIKLWLNGKIVHANNAVRGLTPGEDRGKASLREGWNDLFAKVTQSTAGWGMMLNLKSPRCGDSWLALRSTRRASGDRLHAGDAVRSVFCRRGVLW